MVVAKPEVKPITLTRDQIRALDCAVKYPSQATVRRARHKLDDVYALVAAGLVEWLHREHYNFIATEAGRAYYQRHHAIEKLKSAGWQVYQTPDARTWILATPERGEHGAYRTEAEAWDSVLEGRVQS